MKSSRPPRRLARIMASSPAPWMGMPRLRSLDAARVVIDAEDVEAEFGKAGAENETDIAGTDHRDLHALTPRSISRLGGR